MSDFLFLLGVCIASSSVSAALCECYYKKKLKKLTVDLNKLREAILTDRKTSAKYIKHLEDALAMEGIVVMKPARQKTERTK